MAFFIKILTGKTLFLMVLWIICFVPSFGQERKMVFNQESEPLFFFEGNSLYGAQTGAEIYSITGNTIFFSGGSESRDVLAMVNVADVFGKKRGEVIQPGKKKPIFSIWKGSFFLGEKSLPGNTNLLGYLLNNQQDGYIAFYNGINDSLMGYIEGNSATSAELVATFYLFFSSCKLEEKVLARINQAGQTRVTHQGIIKPFWGSSVLNEWTWDGQVFAPRWMNRPDCVWHFDGKYLKPWYGGSPDSEWTWDGQILRRSWGMGQLDEWLWDGNTLKPYWNQRMEYEWRFEDNRFRPVWGNDVTREWVVEGNVPLPVLFFIVLGLPCRF